MKKNKVSIIVPVYNKEKYIDECIQSIINQTYKKIEIIIVDDGSTDDSEKIIKKYINSKSKIEYIKQHHQGGSVARNRGLEVATGDYIMFFDADDVLELDAIESMLEKNDENDIIIGNYHIMNEDNNLIDSKKIIKKNIIDKKNIFKKYYDIPPTLGSKMYKRSIIVENNINFANVRIGQDLNFYIKFLSCAKTVCGVDNFIFRYRIVNNSVSRTYSSNIFGIVESIREIKSYLRRNNKQDLIDKYMSKIELSNYNEQMSKLVCFDKKEDRRIILLYFKKLIKQINFDKIKEQPNNKKLQRKVRLKLLLGNVYISNQYRKFYLYKKSREELKQ